MEKKTYQKHEHGLLYENIKALASYRGLRMQDIEKQIYRQPGYISRGKNFTADELKKVAGLLQVSMDDLMEKDFKTHIGQMNILMLMEINVEELKKTMGKGECMREMLRIITEVYDKE